MRIRLDECVDPRVKQLFTDHHIAFTVHEQGLDSLDDGELLRAAAQEFDVLLTIDRNLEYQQNLARFQIAVVVVRVPKNQIRHYARQMTAILDAVGRAIRGKAEHVPPANTG